MKLFYKLITVISIFLFMISCTTIQETFQSTNDRGKDIAMDEKRADDFIQSQNQFMVKLYHQLADSDNNIFFSPVSINSALGMTYQGARGETAEEMAELMEIEGEKQQHAALNRLFMEHINSLDNLEGIEMLLANALWKQEGYPFREEYLKTLQNDFFARSQALDFQGNPSNSVQTINNWVSEKTRENITDLISEQAISPLTRLVLTNAIYFYGLWELPFDEDSTRERAFTLSSGEEIKTPFMHQTEDFPYAETEDFKVLQLPYEGEKLAMVIILPSEGTPLKEIEQQLTWEEIQNALDKMSTQEVRTAIPRFSMRSQFSLRSYLEAMGMKKAFQPEAADFSDMDGGERDDLHISSVVHEAFIEVTEEGTEAAAATGVVIGVTSYTQPRTFHADRPFLFFIHDTDSEAVLFGGRLMNPEDND